MTEGPPPLGIDRVPPQAVEIEQAIIGARLIDPRGIKRARDIISPDAFYHQPHGVLFDAICDCYEAEGEADQLMVSDYLKGTGRLDEIGGVVYIAELAACTVTAANITHHIKIVKRKHAARQGIEAAAEITRRLYEDNGHAPDDILQEHADTAGRITSGTAVAGVSMNQTMEAAEGDYEAAADRFARGIPFAGIDSGNGEVNDFLNGFCPEELTVDAARPSIGKTTQAWQWGLHAAQQGYRVAGISLEMSRRQVGGLLLRLQGRLDPEGLRKGNLSQDHIQRMQAAAQALRTYPITLVDKVPLNIEEVRATITEVEAQGHVDLWIIDYLQLITNDGSDSELDVISRVCKNLTLEHGNHILLLSQLNRDCEKRHDKRPQLADLRGSGGIEQNANNVVMIHRPGFYPDLVAQVRKIAKAAGDDPVAAVAKLEAQATLIFTKTRNGPTGETRGLTWHKPTACFQEGIDHDRDF